MFNKKKCKRCGEKIGKDFDFCPYCGTKNSGNAEDWGMLGKNDFIQETEPFQNSLFGNAGFGMLDKMLGSAMKMLENEMQKEFNEMQNHKRIPHSNFELFINGKRIDPRNIKVSQRQIKQPVKKQQKASSQKLLKTFDENQQKKFSKLSKQTPETKVRRLSNKIVYEIQVPGVKSIEDVSIIKLEKSIEIKAIAKDKAYEKIIQINLPITNYELDKDNLILELAGE